MRLASYSFAPPAIGRGEHALRAAIVLGDKLIDAATFARLSGIDSSRDLSTVRGLLNLEEAARGELFATASTLVPEEALVDQQAVFLGPPVPDPDKIICVGRNYADHAAEIGAEVPEAPTLFAKFRNCLAGSGSAIPLPAVSASIDFEGELAFVIGARARDVPVERAASVIAGYMPFNDVTARDLQRRTSQWTSGKALDGFAPCGPHLVLADGVGAPGSFELTTRLNGEVVQRASTDQMIFSIAELVAHISSLMTLEPGDIVATGTPAGVGAARVPPVFLADGDEVEVSIAGVGTLANRFVSV